MYFSLEARNPVPRSHHRPAVLPNQNSRRYLLDRWSMQSSPPSRIKRYRLISLLGSTHNSVVYVTMVPGTSDKQAIKLIDHRRFDRQRIDNECNIQSLLRHPYIMPLHESFDFQDFRAMLMPRAIGGSLFDIDLAPLPFAKTLYRLFKGIQYLHTLHILHGDIKPSNILLLTCDLEEPHPVIIDFGHAANLTCRDCCTCRLMTCCYSSPELLALRGHSFASDIWSLAATAYVVISKREVIRNADLAVMAQLAAKLRLSFEGDRWERYPTSLQSLIVDMMRVDPESRLSIEKCLAHQFFTEMLGKEWIRAENETVRILAGSRLNDELVRVKSAVIDRKGP
jgi:serine/threonine protein kinase